MNRLRQLWPARLAVPASPLPPRTLNQETILVLLLGLGASAIYSILSIARTLSTHVALNKQVTTMNTSQAQQPWLDLIHQLVGIGLGLVPVLLVLHLLAREIPRPMRYLGLDGSSKGRDLGLGIALAAAIGIPGLVLYVVARDLGFNTTIAASGLGEHWWSVPVLIGSAFQNAAAEEVVMVGYLYTRWSQAGWKVPAIVLVSALIRGSYHLYQGFGGLAGNFVMGLILGTVYLKYRRVAPLVIAHTILDICAFVGYALLHTHVSWLQ